MSAFSTLFSFTMAATTLRMAVPYACAAVAGVVGERSGVVNIALEGILLVSGLFAVLSHLASGSAVVGLVVGLAAGALFGLVHGVLTVVARTNAIVSGVALNFVAAGGTRFLLRTLCDSSSNSPKVTGFVVPGLENASGFGSLVRALVEPPTLLAVLFALLVRSLLGGTRFGLRLRACGEDPRAAASAGVSVTGVRLAALSLGGAIAGLGGVALAFDQHQFQAGMSGGRGFIALAAVILSGWRPVPALLASLVFAGLDALQIVLQDQRWLPSGLVQSLPFVATLLALYAVGRRTGRDGLVSMKPPAGIGQHP